MSQLAALDRRQKNYQPDQRRKVVVRDVLKSREWFANVMATMDDLIITADDARFIERFDGERWNASRTRRIIDKGG